MDARYAYGGSERISKIQLPEQDFLRLAEGAKTLAFLDIEATGLRGDYNSVLVGSIYFYGYDEPFSFKVKQPGNDNKVVRQIKYQLEQADAWVTYYGKGFDIPMLNTRLLRWGVNPIPKRPHIDLYYTLKYNVLTARKSQGHLLSWLETPEEKMTVGADTWNAVIREGSEGKAMKTMVKRCESDVMGLKALYEKTKHLIREIKR